MKKMLALLTSIIMVCNCAISVNADNEIDYPVGEDIIEEYLYTSSISNELSFIGTTAKCKSTVVGFPEITTKIEITNTLQKKYGNSWYNSGSQSGTSYLWGTTLTTYEYNQSSGKYRLKTTAKVYCGSEYETIIIYSDEVNH